MVFLLLLYVAVPNTWARHFHGDILRDTGNSEYGKTEITITGDNPIWRDIPEKINVWMSHNDTIELQENVIAHRR